MWCAWNFVCRGSHELKSPATATLLASFCTSMNCTCFASPSKSPSTSFTGVPRSATFAPINPAKTSAAVTPSDNGRGVTKRRRGMNRRGQRAIPVLRTALMMRESTSPPTGSFRSSRRRFSMNGSRSGSTMHFLQQFTEPVAGAQHAHLERRYSDAGQLRHLLVTQVLDILHQKRFALVRPELLHGAIDLFTPRVTIRRVLLRRAQQCRFVGDERPPAAC